MRTLGYSALADIEFNGNGRYARSCTFPRDATRGHVTRGWRCRVIVESSSAGVPNDGLTSRNHGTRHLGKNINPIHPKLTNASCCSDIAKRDPDLLTNYHDITTGNAVPVLV
jgi:hypothetical protein